MATQQPLSEQLAYIYGLERFGIKLGLEVIEALLAELGNPHRRFPSVHITGTNGKGSTAAFLASCLTTGGLSVGLYTSPHLQRFNERIVVSGKEITDETLILHIARIKVAAEKLNLQPTFFEFTTALAFLEFAQQGVDIAVIEVGMGGTLDATNVITPLVSVITNIGLDHADFIGPTKRDIALNKAGIIKLGVPVVTAETDAEIIQLLAGASRQKKSILYEVSKEMPITELAADLAGQRFVTAGAFTDTFSIRLLGRHQIDNARTALVTLKLLQKQGVAVSDTAIKQGLSETRWPGRLDIISHQPFVLVDGAHNTESAQRLIDFLSEALLPKRGILVLAQKKGKNLQPLFAKLAPSFRRVITTEGSYEPESAIVLARAVSAYQSSVQAVPQATAAIELGLNELRVDEMMLVTGSLYMIGDALVLFAAS